MTNMVVLRWIRYLFSRILYYIDSAKDVYPKKMSDMIITQYISKLLGKQILVKQSFVIHKNVYFSIHSFDTCET